MQNDVATTIKCSNEGCNAINNDTDKYCQQCGTPITKRYLWAVGEGFSALKIGEIVQSRYLLVGDRIFLDTLPSNSPKSRSADISSDVKPYLRLVPYRLQIPQVYTWWSLSQLEVLPAQELETTKILLLEDGAIYSSGEIAGQLMPQLSTKWKDATSLRQLHWLWQIAGLWQPLSAEGVASSLLNPQLIRVEQSIIHLLQLQLDVVEMPPKLSQLGEVWHQLIPEAKPAIGEYLERLCYGLITEEISHSDFLSISLEKALTECGKSHTYNITTTTLSDKGPSRQRNEDACYPPSGTTKTTEKTSPIAANLTIVCDGIGGHEGGNVASNLAIETITAQVEQLKLAATSDDYDPLVSALEQATHTANDRISDRNDSESRSGRQRMGTTLVMALARKQQIYITHVGDSRAYLITRTGCHQVTLDDDVAAREVRLGYSLYSTALLQPSSGSLIQALGMNLALHPTVNRFVLDEDCIFLLCSDGLSDYDRVEQHWDTEILPVIEDKIPLANAALRLIEVANTHNGHDNVTVSLIHYQGNFVEPPATVSPTLAVLETNPVEESIVDEPLENLEPIIEPPTEVTKFVAPVPKKPSPTPIILGLVLLFGLSGLAYLFIEPLQNLFKPKVGSNQPISSSTPSISPPRISPQIAFESVFQIKTLSGVAGSTVNNNNLDNLSLRSAPELTPSKPSIGAIAPGNIVQVAEQKTLDRQKWLLLKVCASTTEVAPLSGWIPETELAAVIEQAPATTCFVSSKTTRPTPTNQPSVELPK